MPDLAEDMPQKAAPPLVQPATPPAMFRRDFTIRGVSLDEKDVDELLKLLHQKTTDARRLEVAHAIAVADPKNPPEKTDLEREVEQVFRIGYTIRDTTGRSEISGFDNPQLGSGHVSHEIASLWITNREAFEIAVRRRPRNYFDIFIDFARPSMALNLLNVPSNPTPNGSCLNVIGFDEDWVVTTHQRLIEFFDRRKTRWGWIHESGVYDAFLYVFVVPFVLWRAYLFEKHPPDWMVTDSTIAIILIYIYGFLIFLILARQIFLYARWMFPAVEFNIGRKRSPTFHRLVFGAVVLGLIVWLSQQIISAAFL